MSDSDSNDSKGTYYHYTDEKGAMAIKESGMILASRKLGPRDDAAFGDGTYLTKLGPQNSTKTLVENNYDYRLSPQQKVAAAEKTQYYVELQMSNKDVTMQNTGRNVGLYKKGDLYLKDYEHKISKRQDKK